jgi:hypothetical protein
MADSDVAPAELDAFCEDPLAELGIYSSDEDCSSWGFDRLYNDSQWQEPNLTLLGSGRRFTGPLPGPTQPAEAKLSMDCLAYFMRY